MALKYDYKVEVYDGAQWLETRFKTLTLSRSLYWNKPPTVSLTLSNNRGSARLLCAIARKLRVKRNGVQEYYGIINTPGLCP